MVGAALGIGAVLVARRPEGVADVPPAHLLVWTVLVAGVELWPVPGWRGLQVSLGFPLLMVVAFLYPPLAGALVAFVGSFDPWEFRRDANVLTALFNRSQVALAVLAASLAFHGVADLHASSTLRLLGAATLATVADYAVNVALVGIWASLKYRTGIAKVVRELRIGSLPEFLISYLALALLGLVMAKFFLAMGFWSVPAFLLPLMFARQMFFRSRALEEAHKELQEREQVLQALSVRMAEERQDERLQIAGYLHDDLAQLL
ncbi:MAG TPA: hypothetical protein VNO79_09300, partial [Actinomycetota bacterium]|nr:hypothetical protein [Actinomycetota bacterium]